MGGMCLQMGAKVNQTWIETGKTFSTFTWGTHFEIGDANCLLMLLSAGADPLASSIPTKIPRKLKPQIQLWLASLETAKQCLAAIFDDAMLEKEIADFVFNETFLRNS